MCNAATVSTTVTGMVVGSWSASSKGVSASASINAVAASYSDSVKAVTLRTLPAARSPHTRGQHCVEQSVHTQSRASDTYGKSHADCSSGER